MASHEWVRPTRDSPYTVTGLASLPSKRNEELKSGAIKILKHTSNPYNYTLRLATIKPVPWYAGNTCNNLLANN